MILDNATFLSGSFSPTTGALIGQAVAGTNTNVLGTNTIDLAPLLLGGNQMVGSSGDTLDIAFTVQTAPTGGTSVQFQLVQADDAALTTNVEVLAQTGVFTIAQLPAGTLVPLGFGRTAPLTPRRFIGVRYVLVGSIASMVVVASTVADVSDLRTIFKSNFAIL